MNSSGTLYAAAVLRIGLAVVFLWFGMTQMADTANWTGWVPDWASALSGLAPETIVLMNAAFEVIAGSFLAIGLAVRWVALLLTLHLVLIIFEIGLTAIGMRDVGLAVATFALSLMRPDDLTLDADRI